MIYTFYMFCTAKNKTEIYSKPHIVPQRNIAARAVRCGL